MLRLHGQVGSPELGDGLLPVLGEGEAEAAADDGPEVAEGVHEDLQVRSKPRQLLHTAQVLLLQELVAVPTLQVNKKYLFVFGIQLIFILPPIPNCCDNVLSYDAVIKTVKCITVLEFETYMCKYNSGRFLDRLSHLTHTFKLNSP